MNDVMSRIAQIQTRFAATPASRVAAASTSEADAATSASFSSVLSSVKASAVAAGGAASSSTASAAELTGAMSQALMALAQRAVSGETAPAVPASYERYREEIAQVATQEGVPASLLGALVWSESGFDPSAVSPAGARGLAQLMPSTAEGLGVDIDDPADNLRGGARYLRAMLDRFGRTDLALAAYNAGPNAVARAGGIPPYQETQTYVTRVLTRATALSGGTPHESQQ